MKRGFRLPTPDLRLVAALCVGLTTFSSPALALTLNNPYEPIVGRNVFALRPPTPLTNAVTTPVVAPAGIELQGLTTILGRPQVLLKIKLQPRPPEPAKDQSFVLDIGQREGEVEVLAIDITAGTVQLKNQGKELALNMKDAAKPAAGAAIPMAPGSPPSNIPGLPPPPRAPAAAAAGANVNTFGGTSSRTTIGAPTPTLPSRSVRSNAAMSPAEDRTFRETQVALIEVEREINKDNPKYPPPPPTPMTPNP